MTGDELTGTNGADLDTLGQVGASQLIGMLGHFCSSRVASSIIASQESTACSRTARSNMRSHVSITYALGAANIVAGPSQRLLDRDGSRHPLCTVHRAVIHVRAGGAERPVKRSLILQRRRGGSVVKGYAVLDASLTAVGITRARAPRPLNTGSDSHGLRAGAKHVVGDRNPTGWRRSVDAIVGWAGGGSAATSPATIK